MAKNKNLDEPNEDDEGKLRRVASVLAPIISSIRGDAFIVQHLFKSGKMDEKKEDVEQMLERIIKKANELEEIRLQISN